MTDVRTHDATTARTALRAARSRTRALLAPFDDDTLRRQHSPLMSPLVWDLAHVGNYEELWLVRALGGDPLRPDVDHLYDAFEQPRATRPALPLLGPAEAWDYVDRVRERAEQILDSVSPDAGDPLRRGHFVHGMVAQHEQQHIETMLATIQLMAAPGLRPPLPGPRAADPSAVGEVLVPGGPFTMGTDAVAWAYDNERPAHVVDVGPFWIDTTPVTNEAYAAFVDAGGYDDAAHWSADGWRWRCETGAAAPLFWQRDEGDWVVDRFGHRVPLEPAAPVQHVCWYEADAYARWAGRRLPTEAEWEKAAAWDPDSGTTRPFPWGATPPDGDPPGEDPANLGGHRWGPDPVGSRPAGRSPVGCHQMIGDVWEWTATDFHGYPGFRSFPYREYSEVFFGDRFKVLRGGSWATDAVAVRTTFRNWDFPVRRQIFAGFRCARDA